MVSPIMYDNKKYWLELKQICSFLKEIKATTHKECAGHIHFGANIFGNDYYTLKDILIEDRSKILLTSIKDKFI